MKFLKKSMTSALALMLCLTLVPIRGLPAAGEADDSNTQVSPVLTAVQDGSPVEAPMLAEPAGDAAPGGESGASGEAPGTAPEGESDPASPEPPAAAAALQERSSADLTQARSKIKSQYHPVYGTDTNLLDMIRASIGDGTIEVSLKTAVTGSYSGIAADGTIAYYDRDPADTNWAGWFEWLNNIPVILSKDGETVETTTRCRLYWDQAKAKGRVLNLADVKLTADMLRGKNESLQKTEGLLILPAHMNTAAYDTPEDWVSNIQTVKSGAVAWAPVTWTWVPDQAAHQSAVRIEDTYRKKGSVDQQIYGPYIGTVTRGREAMTGKLVATFAFNRANTGENFFTAIKKEFAVSIPADPSAEDPQAALQRVLDTCYTADLLTVFGSKPTVSIDLNAVTADIQLPIRRTIARKASGEDKKLVNNSTFTVTSDDPAIAINGYRANVFRPLPGEPDQTVKLTVRMKHNQTGRTAEKTFELKVQALQLAELQTAKALMDRAAAHYQTALMGGNTDPNEIRQKLSSFQEIYLNESGDLAVARIYSETKGVGIFADSLDPEHLQEAYNRFRSSQPGVISHENLLLKKPQYNQTVTIDSVLSHHIYAKYAEKLPAVPGPGESEAVTLLRALLKVPVSATFRVPGTTGQDDPNARITGTFVVEGSKIIHKKEDHANANEIWLSVPFSVPRGTTLEALTRQIIDASAGHTLVIEHGFLKTIGIKDKGINTYASTNGPASSWMWYQKPADAAEFSEGQVMASAYELQPGETVKWTFVNDPNYAMSVAQETPDTPLPLPDTPEWWTGYRGDNAGNQGVRENMNITDPSRTAAWVSAIEEKNAWGYPAQISDLLILDDRIYYAADNHLVRLSRTGERERVTELRASILYFSRLSFANGLIIVPLNGGGVQAVDPETMETRWVTASYDQMVKFEPNDQGEWEKKTYGLQSLGTTYIADGVAYVPLTAIDGSASVGGCLRAIDMSTGEELWQYSSQVSGFYWSGGVAAGDYLIIGSDNGDLLAFRKDGSNRARPETFNIGQAMRSTVVRQGQNLYFTTTDGRLHEIAFDETLGRFDAGSHRSVAFAHYSTSTPTVYAGKAYVGGAAAGGYGAGGIFAVIDLSDLSVQKFNTEGDVKSAPLVVTDQSARTYVYFAANGPSGKLYVYTDGELKEAYEPTVDQKNYTTATPVIDRNGLIYYTTDAGVILALKSGQQTITHELRIWDRLPLFLKSAKLVRISEGELLSDAVLKLHNNTEAVQALYGAAIKEKLGDVPYFGIRMALSGTVSDPFRAEIEIQVDPSRLSPGSNGRYQLYRLNRSGGTVHLDPVPLVSAGGLSGPRPFMAAAIWGGSVLTPPSPAASVSLRFVHDCNDQSLYILAAAPVSADPKPSQTKPSQSKPGQTKPGQTQPGQTQPGQTQPGQTQPEQTKPGQTQPGQTQPGQSQPGQTQPSQSQPVQTQPGQPGSAAVKPSATPVRAGAERLPRAGQASGSVLPIGLLLAAGILCAIQKRRYSKR